MSTDFEHFDRFRANAGVHFERMKNKLQKESETEKSGGSDKSEKNRIKQLSGAWPEVTIVATSDHCGQKLPFRDVQEKIRIKQKKQENQKKSE